MPFPDSPRVIYQRNPLDQVICQLRFPPILKIDTQVPSDFQDAIRGDYPLYFENKEPMLNLSPEILAQVPPEVINAFPIPATNRLNYRFATVDEIWNVNLTNNFLALSTKKYDRWENFRQHLTIPLEAFVNVYKPAFCSRIGLRYVDVIRKSSLGLSGTNWSDLIQPHIAGILSYSEIPEGIIQGSISNEEIKLDDGKSIVRIVHGLATLRNDGEIVYLIDCDFFLEEKTEISNVLEKLDYYNHLGRRLFRWCITEQLHGAMQPQPI
jgi:uncharacterized protein (TIGR04255 family)